MSDETGRVRASNPFVTRCVRPGAVAYLFPSHDDLAQLLTRWHTAQRCGQIIGPHGSGKSTLLETLIPAIEAEGCRVVRFTLHDGQRRLPEWPDASPADDQTVVIIDGFEQLSWLSAWRIKRRLRRVGSGLIVTAHRSQRLPTLYTTATDLARTKVLVQSLMAGYPQLITGDDVATLYNQYQGDIRELLFALFDLFEQRLKKRS